MVKLDSELWRKELLSIWQKFCDLHQQLYQVTCKEYQLLLRGHIDDLDKCLLDKIDIINEIKKMELKRKSTVRRVASIQNASELMRHVQSQKLAEYNKFLIETIKKLQEQNKKNQIFINKAMHNLRGIRDELTGYHSRSTYDSKGRPWREAISSMG